MLIEINMLKNYLPSNLNRDENGAPKTCMFGGVKRNRISSQCMKRSWRRSEIFSSEIGSDKLGVRTRNMPELVADKLLESGIKDDVVAVVKEVLSSFGTTKDKATDNLKTPTVIMYGSDDIEDIAEYALSAVKGKTVKDVDRVAFKKELELALKDNSKRSVSVDMALWGRMVTSDALADVDAAMRVAHAISTNKAMVESDFFTTFDDYLTGEESFGAGMMDYTDYTSACFYIYASIDTDILVDNLANAENKEELVNKIVCALVETMAYTNPSGKQTSFAAASLPSAILVEMKSKKIAADYSSAFETPIKSDIEHSLSYNSAKSLADTCNKLQDKFAIPVDRRLWFCMDDDITVNDAEICKSFRDLLNGLRVF